MGRTQWLDKSQEKGKNKTFLWGYRNPETGEIKRQRVESVPLYRFNEVLDYTSSKCFLAVEGEKSVDACRSIKLVASEITALSKDIESLLSLKEKDATPRENIDMQRTGNLGVKGRGLLVFRFSAPLYPKISV